MAEIVPVTSEALEAQVRELLPSQRGFGEDLQASNVITPIIDLTPVAEGTQYSESIQQAYSFGSITPFSVSGTTTTIISTPGFYNVIGTCNITDGGGGARSAKFVLNDGVSDKTFQNYQLTGSTLADFNIFTFEFTVFLPSGHILKATTDSSAVDLDGSSQQIADVNGNTVYPSGFTPQ